MSQYISHQTNSFCRQQYTREISKDTNAFWQLQKQIRWSPSTLLSEENEFFNSRISEEEQMIETLEKPLH